MKRRHEGSRVSWWRGGGRPIDHETHFLLLYSLATLGQLQCCTAGNGITKTQAAPGCFIWSREGWVLLETGEIHLWPWWTSHQYRRYMIGRGRRESCLTIISKERPVARLLRRVVPKIDAIYPLLPNITYQSENSMALTSWPQPFNQSRPSTLSTASELSSWPLVILGQAFFAWDETCSRKPLSTLKMRTWAIAAYLRENLET